MVIEAPDADRDIVVQQAVRLRSSYWTLRNRQCVRVYDVAEWVEWIRGASDDLEIAKAIVGEYRILTRFVGYDALSARVPQIFQTTVQDLAANLTCANVTHSLAYQQAMAFHIQTVRRMEAEMRH